MESGLRGSDAYLFAADRLEVRLGAQFWRTLRQGWHSSRRPWAVTRWPGSQAGFSSILFASLGLGVLALKLARTGTALG